MSESWVFFEPVDVWSFRDGRPFEAGESFAAGTLFPPAPRTTLGALRTALLRRSCPQPERYAGRGGNVPCPRCGDGPCAAVAEVGEAGGEAPFAVGPPLVASRQPAGGVELWWRVPADLVGLAAEADQERVESALLRPQSFDAEVSCSAPLPPVLPGRPGRIQPWPRPYLSTAELAQSLAGKAPSWPSVEALGARPEPLVAEPRVGVGIDPARRSVREGQLYVRDTVRLADGYGLAVRTSHDLELAGEVLRLGGDGRMALLHRVTPARLPEPPENPGIRIKVVLASPCLLSGGWRPGWLDEDGSGELPGTGVRLRLVGAALAPPVRLGGWDLARQRPRALERLAGAGSVYFFEVITGDPAGVVEELHGKSFSDDETMARAGFGLAFVGRF